MATAAEPEISDAAELQKVLTRYSDSYFGYLQAAKEAQSEGAAAAFLEIASRRELIVRKIACLIKNEGEKPDTHSSPEGTLHRWWIRVRTEMSEDEFRITLEECVRGETELARTVADALEYGNLQPEHAKALSEMATELKEALRTFTIALGRY
jgi:uncharacterized protein (TIGR02284 family)